MENKMALVTGANKGIGFEICLQLAEADYKVILTARNEKKGVEAAEKLKSIGLHVFFHPLDVTNPESISKLAHYVSAEFGHIDVLINNAGIISSSKKISEVGMDEIKKVMDTNFLGVIKVTQAFLPLLKKSKNGKIINISSGMGQIESLSGDYAAYRLSKAGLNAITLMFANEVNEYGIKVNAICPGWVKSDMGGPNAPRSVKQGADTAVWLALESKTPTGKLFRDRAEIEW
jgi:NAD(P)-dependent dehydrogenase (short-subunit alcohol dehydrogenase family)